MKFSIRLINIYALSLLITSLPLIAAGETPSPSENTVPSREEVQRFSRAYHEIKAYYVEPVADKKLFENAIRGMVNGLDPHSTFLDSQELRDLKDATTGEFTGLGMEVSMENGYIKVISPIDETPAQRGGIKPSDLIVKLDDIPTKGMSLRDAVNKMRAGKKGSVISLTVIRKNEAKPLVIKLIRDVIRVKSVKSRMLEPGYGYIRISSFQLQTGPEVKKAAADLMKQSGGHLKGLVLDLRNNPGGLLDAAVEVSNAFLNNKPGKKGLIVYTKGRIPSSQFEARANGADVLRGAPVIVLINEGSASGSEIVAGALQDQGRAILVGTNTFGKGSVQTVLPLDETTGIKLTTALYYTPSGRSIQAEGIHPDIVIEELKVTDNADAKMIEAIKEADLINHLYNGNHKKGSKKLSSNAENQEDAIAAMETGLGKVDVSLVHSDYQLAAALNLLKGLAVYKKDQ